MSNPSRLDHALRMASLGLLVFPLRPGAKEPFGEESWAELATTDPDTIRGWFEHRQGMNYGVCPGEHGVVLDLDRKGDKDGVATLNVMMQEYGEIPHTLHCRSPSGGEHLFLRTHEPVGNAHRFGENSGIDIRGARGYVVGPGSSLVQGLCKDSDTPGDYEVIEDPGELAEAPGWVVSRLRRPSEKAEGDERDPLFDLDKESAVRRAVSFLNDREPAIEGDHGNDHTYATVNHLFDYGLSPDKAFELLATEPLRKKGDESWNDTCVPPWSDDELRRLVDNAWKYRVRPPGAKGGDPEESFGALEEVEGQDISSIAGVNEAVAEAENPFSKFEAMTFRGSEILQRDVRRHSIVPEWLPAHGLTALLAKRGVGKTVTLIDMMGRIAHDMDWHGQPVEEGWTVVYFCGEDDEGFGELLRAWCKKNMVLLDDNRFIMVAGIVDLMDPKNVGDWTRYLKKHVVKDQKTIVVLDTWQRGTSRGSQNDDEEMNKAVGHAEAMAKSLGGPVVASFHPPKHDGQVVMGSSVIENQTVAIWHEDQLGDGSRQLMVTRIKGKGYGNQMHFNFEEVGLNEVDEHGKERTGVVPILKWGIDAGGAADTGNSRSDAEKKYDLALIIAELCKDRAGQDWSGGRDSFTIRELARRILPDPNFNDGMPSLLQQSMDKTDEGELSETAVWARGLIDQFVGIGIDVYRMKVGALRNRLMKEGPDSDMKLGDGTTLVVDASSNKKLLSVRYAK